MTTSDERPIREYGDESNIAMDLMLYGESTVRMTREQLAEYEAHDNMMKRLMGIVPRGGNRMTNTDGQHIFTFSRDWGEGKRLCGTCHLNYSEGDHIHVAVLEPYTSYVCPNDTGQGHSSVWSGRQAVPELRSPTANLCVCGTTYVKEDTEEWLLSWEMKDPHTGDWRPIQRRGTQYSTLQQRNGLLTMTDEIRNVKLVRKGPA